MVEDIVEHIQGSLIQHGHHNDRIYLMQLNTDRPESLISALDKLARKNAYGKIFAKIPAPLWRAFETAGYEKEAVVPGFFRGRIDAFFIAKYLSAERQSSPEDEYVPGKPNQVKPPFEKPSRKAHGALQNIDSCNASDTDEMGLVYRQVFKSYPFPIQTPAFLERMMNLGNLYFCIRVDERIVALAAAEIDLPNQAAEMTDFATLPQWRGKGFAGRLLSHMHHQVRDMGIQTAYTIARAASHGMNMVFKNSGYRYAGLLKNNSQICGSIQSMTLWYRHLW